MAKIGNPNQRSKYKALNARLARYVVLVQQMYDTYNLEAAKLATSVNYGMEKPFRFSDFPTTTKRLDDILTNWRRDLSAIITTGTAKEWGNSNLTQDMLADKALAYYYGKSHGRRVRRYYQKNSDALKAFQTRVDNGMNLSQKIWDQSRNYKTELEAAVSAGIQKGMSAVTLSKRVSKYLNDFDQLKKDYKERYGREVDCLNCEYRSIRLARSEINMAYRTAEQERWKQFDFVLGYEIKLSQQHDAHMPHGDICDDLKGKYPKDFKWTGWHPNDMCYAVPILKTEEEFFAEDEESAGNEVTDVPDQYKEWCASNIQRIKKADRGGTLPYFLQENPDFRQYLGVDYIAEWRHKHRDEDAIRLAAYNRQMMNKLGDNLRMRSLRRHAHAIGADISDVERLISSSDLKWDKYGISDVLDNALEEAEDRITEQSQEVHLLHLKLKSLLSSIKSYRGPYRVQSVIDDIEKAIDGYTPYSPPYGKAFTKEQFDAVYKRSVKALKAEAAKADAANQLDIESALGIKKGHPMSFKEADEGRGNIRYKPGIVNPYSVNCQVCVVADELRRRGYDVTALGRLLDRGKANEEAHHTELPWFEKGTGRSVHKKRITLTGKKEEQVFSELDRMTKAKGRYHIDWGWKGANGNGHIVCLERRANGSLRYYDPQTGYMTESMYDIEKLISRMDDNYALGVLRVDNLLVESKYLRSIVKAL